MSRADCFRPEGIADACGYRAEHSVPDLEVSSVVATPSQRHSDDWDVPLLNGGFLADDTRARSPAITRQRHAERQRHRGPDV